MHADSYRRFAGRPRVTSKPSRRNTAAIPRRAAASPGARPDSPGADLQPLHEAALERLRERIVRGDLAPAAKLNERVLCAQLGISRTPLREALKVLASEGLVKLLPNRGAVVSPIDPQRVREIFAVLGALEALAGELACRNAAEADIAEIRALHYQMVAHYARGELAEYFRFNQQIHIRLAEVGGNAALAATYRLLNAQVRRARYFANLSGERWAQAVREHEAILEALAARDAPRLTVLLREHLGHKMAAFLQSFPADPETADRGAASRGGP